MGVMTEPTRAEVEADRAAARARLGDEIEPVDVFRPWDEIDPDVRESTPDELVGRT
jgi:hypothetical protein